MKQLVSSVIREMRPYFDNLLRNDPETGSLYIVDEELGDRASCGTTGLTACIYSADGLLHGGDGFEIAHQLMKEVRRRQLSSGAFGQPFYVKKGDPVTVDIAEIGAVANSLYHVYKITGCEDAKESLIHSVEYLLTQVAKQNPAVILKRPGENFDVLNGDMYAAHAFARAYQLSGNPEYLEKVNQVFKHLINRFGKNTPGWWPYIENWDGTVVMGNSVMYQATIIAFAHTALPLLSKELREEWSRVSDEALDTILTAIRNPPNDETEAPWWARDWDNGWELHMCLSRDSADPDIQERGKNRFREVASMIQEQGISLFNPIVKNDDPDRTPVSTTFRKASGFAAVVSYLLLDDWQYETADTHA
ncbi:hypothetical protein [Paenibacillus marinisediminis]